MSVPAVATPPRRRLRPYVVSLERSRQRWKARATQARAQAHALRRQLRRLVASRDAWRDQARGLRRQLRHLRHESAKNAPRS